MKITSNYNLVLILLFALFYGCSSTARYSRTNNNSENESRSNDLAALEIEIGTASFYANEFDGKRTANGEVYDMNDLTAAHPTYAFNTIVKVTNLSNGKNVEVRINDRMPQFKGRIIDLSFAAAREIEMVNAGIQEVKLEVIKWGK